MIILLPTAKVDLLAHTKFAAPSMSQYFDCLDLPYQRNIQPNAYYIMIILLGSKLP